MGIAGSGINAGKILFELAIVDRGRWKGAMKDAESQIDSFNNRISRIDSQQLKTLEDRLSRVGTQIDTGSRAVKNFQARIDEAMLKSQSSIDRGLGQLPVRLSSAEAAAAKFTKQLVEMKNLMNLKLKVDQGSLGVLQAQLKKWEEQRAAARKDKNPIDENLYAARIEKGNARLKEMSALMASAASRAGLEISMKEVQLGSALKKVETIKAEIATIQSAKATAPLALTQQLDEARVKVEVLRKEQAALQASMTAITSKYGGAISPMNAFRASAAEFQKFGIQMQKIAKDMTLQWSLAFGLLTGLSIKGAVDFDRSMRDVQGTAGLTEQEFHKLSDTLKDVSRNLPTKNAAQGLAEIAAVAGQAGISGVENLTKFSTSVTKLVTVFEGLDAKDTAKKLIQIARSYGFPIENIEKFGAVVARVSKDSVGTAEEIIAFNQAIGGAAKNLGISFDKVNALAGTLIDMGISANVAGTAITNLFTKMALSPNKFSQEMGVTVGKFKKMVGEDATQALLVWLNAIKSMDMSDATEAIAELGIRGYRATNVIQKLRTEGIKPFIEEMKRTAEEMRTGQSLNDRYEIVLKAVSSQLEMIKNKFQALSITMGQHFFPILLKIMGVFEKVVGFIEALPGPIKDFAFNLMFVTAVAGPLILVLGNLINMLGGLAMTIGLSSGGLGMGLAAVIGGLALLMTTLSGNTDNAAASTEALNTRLRDTLSLRGQVDKKHLDVAYGDALMSGRSQVGSLVKDKIIGFGSNGSAENLTDEAMYRHLDKAESVVKRQISEKTTRERNKDWDSQDSSAQGGIDALEEKRSRIASAKSAYKSAIEAKQLMNSLDLSVNADGSQPDSSSHNPKTELELRIDMLQNDMTKFEHDAQVYKLKLKSKGLKVDEVNSLMNKYFEDRRSKINSLVGRRDVLISDVRAAMVKLDDRDAKTGLPKNREAYKDMGPLLGQEGSLLGMNPEDSLIPKSVNHDGDPRAKEILEDVRLGQEALNASITQYEAMKAQAKKSGRQALSQFITGPGKEMVAEINGTRRSLITAIQRYAKEVSESVEVVNFFKSADSGNYTRNGYDKFKKNVDGLSKDKQKTVRQLLGSQTTAKAAAPNQDQKRSVKERFTDSISENADSEVLKYKAADAAIQSLTTGFGSAFKTMMTSGKNFGQVMSKIFTDLIADIAAMIIQMLAMQAIAALFGIPVGGAAAGGAASVVGNLTKTAVNPGSPSGSSTPSSANNSYGPAQAVYQPIIIQSAMEGQTFFRKTEPAYSRNKATRKGL